MKKNLLSPKQRWDIYQTALAWYHLHGIFRGVCGLLFDIAYLTSEPTEDLVQKVFPEFYAQRPKKVPNKDGYWWKKEDVESRIEALKQAIKLVEEKLK